MAHFNFRLFLRPTAVGKMIIDRLTSEGVDRQADARRWIELGYMCEQAGFRVDGTTLFQAGRPAVSDLPTPAQVAVYGLSPAPASAPVGLSSAAPDSAPVSVVAREVEQPISSVGTTLGNTSHPVPSQAAVANSPQAIDSDLTTNLRNLAH